MSTVAKQRHAHLQALAVPLTYLPTIDAEIHPYLPEGQSYQLLYALLRAEGVSVAESLLLTLRQRRDDLVKAIAGYEKTHLVVP